MNEFTAPVPDETDATDLVVTGALPTELSGRYFRNGPNPRPGEFAPHWFMGSGMLHGVRLRDGRAEWYRNRWVKFTDVDFVRPDGTLDYRGGPANTSVLEHSGRLFALVEQAFPYEIDRELNTIGYCDFGGRLTTAMTAHPKTDPVTGELHFFGYSALPPFLTYHRLSATGELVESRPIEVPGPTMMHDFAITENYLVWLDLPAVFDFALVGKTMPYRWSDSYGARIGLMPRTGGTVTWHEIEPCYVFHVGNAREENGQVVLDAVRYSRSAFQGLWTDIGGTADDTPREAHRLYRWSISPSGVREQQLDDREVEFPTHNEARTGRPNQWLYAVSGDAVIKYDTRSGAADVDARGDGWHVGEAVFVAAESPSDRPSGSAGGAAAEDAGWLVSIATHDHPEVPSQLLVHDATEVAAGPVATVHLPRRVPAGFHGAWIADATPFEGEVR